MNKFNVGDRVKRAFELDWQPMRDEIGKVIALLDGGKHEVYVVVWKTEDFPSHYWASALKLAETGLDVMLELI